jgi:hypothetical protein
MRICEVFVSLGLSVRVVNFGQMWLAADLPNIAIGRLLAKIRGFHAKKNREVADGPSIHARTESGNDQISNGKWSSVTEG